jgi:UDP-N-acetylmuramate--alanine ligase
VNAYVARPGTIPTLDVPDLGAIRRLHMIGIGGAGMRNLARLFLARGIEVTGSDLKGSTGVDELRAFGAKIAVGHDAANVGEPDAVVASSAIAESNPELREARRRGVPVWARAQALAAAAADRRQIAVAGTHGKTTTTSMIALVLERTGLEPTYVIGGDPNETGSGARAGTGEVFVAEADESDGSFLLGRPAIGVITNVEVDHVDFYPGGREEIEAAFAEFARRCDHVVVCADDEGAMRRRRRHGAPTARRRRGCASRSPRSVPEARGRVATERAVRPPNSVDGAHNVVNAAASIAVAARLRRARAACEALGSFAGVHRRSS